MYIRVQAQIGIFELFSISGFISCLGRPHDCFLIPVSDAADARGRCALQPGQFRCQHGLPLFICGLLSGFTMAVSETSTIVSLFGFPRSDIWLCRDFEFARACTYVAGRDFSCMDVP